MRKVLDLLAGVTIGASFVCATLAAWPAHAATFTYMNLDDNITALTLHGAIEEGDAQRLADTVNWVKENQHRRVTVLDLDSPGGMLGEAIKIAEMVKGNAVTQVGPDHMCASACFLILAQGDGKYVATTSKIGVHSSDDVTTHAENADTEAATLEMARYLATANVPASILGKLVTTKSNDIYWLTLDEKRAMFTIEDAPLAPFATRTATAAPQPFTPPQPTAPAVAPAPAAPSVPDYKSLALPVLTADCYVQLNGTVVINGPCQFSSYSGIKDFGLAIPQQSFYGVYVNDAAGTAQVAWGATTNTKPNVIGGLTRNRACWENLAASTRVCAWKGQRPRAAS